MSRHSAEHGHTPHSHGKRRHVWPWIVLVVLVAVAAVGAVSALTLYRQAMEVKAHEERAISLMAGLKGLSGSNASGVGKDTVDSINTVLPQLQAETAAAQHITEGTLWSVASHMPVYGKDIATVRGMTRIVHQLTTKPLPQLADTLSTLANASLTTDDGSLNLEPITQAAASMKAANQPLQQLVQQYDALPRPNIGKIATAYDAGRKQLTTAGTTIDDLSNALDIIPGFLGSGGAKTYAVMAMTTSEARSSGGLIGSVGVMATNNGKISVGDFHSNKEYLPYGEGNPTTDEQRIFKDWGPLQMAIDLRDLAVYPDTQRIAEDMRTIWQRAPWGANQQLDGIITVDPVFLQKMVAINGQVTLSDGRVLTGDNTAEFLLNTVYKEYPESMQDQYFTEVATQSISAMFSNINLTKLTQVGQAMSSLAQGRHFSMYSFDEATENSLKSAGFTASTPDDEANPKIGVYIDEQNPSKMGWYVHRTSKLTRTSCNDNGSQTYHVEYTLTNTLTSAEAVTLPEYINGGAYALQRLQEKLATNTLIDGNTGSSKVPSLKLGTAAEKMLIYPPAGGTISHVSSRGSGTVYVNPRSTMLNGKAVTTSLVLLTPGQSVTYSFDVTTSPKATADLGVDQTPMGWEDSGVSVDTSACAIGAK
ncbi:DUF4012 domain-containing protein [Bifidobacterium boum]|uniref:DUF4012 domain-containing protein n=1 Tax=Bifidobacterium boum TaxID=78343 RepID=UPI001F234473|nr:DUF4012 domain-containing protein [Bifidobacterium boum]MCF2561240.1 DUF4012 domain-containing protein [Bifidobacterium boum]